MAAKLVKTDRNGTKYFEDYTCTKCGGSGEIPEYSHVEGGICFTCNGTGQHKHTWKEYTPEYAAKLEERRIAREKVKAANDNIKFLESHGFNKDGFGWVVVGNTYPRKDELKANGAKWLNNIGWTFNHEPSEDKACGFSTFAINVDDITYKNSLGAYQIDNEGYKAVKEQIEELKYSEIRDADNTRYVGEVGEKVDTIVTLDRVSGYDTDWGVTYIYIFKDEEGNQIVWKTSVYLSFDEEDGSWTDVKEGDTIRIAGKVKECAEYRGTKQTVLTRCKYQKAA